MDDRWIRLCVATTYHVKSNENPKLKPKNKNIVNTSYFTLLRIIVVWSWFCKLEVTFLKSERSILTYCWTALSQIVVAHSWFTNPYIPAAHTPTNYNWIYLLSRLKYNSCSGRLIVVKVKRMELNFSQFISIWLKYVSFLFTKTNIKMPIIKSLIRFEIEI